jgi:RNA polymerase subunit RPABC4/transcription elongation factor Spt4
MNATNKYQYLIFQETEICPACQLPLTAYITPPNFRQGSFKHLFNICKPCTKIFPLDTGVTPLFF